MSRLPWIFASIRMVQNLRMLHPLTATDEGQHSSAPLHYL